MPADFFAVGAVIPFITPFGAIATQALVNPQWGVEEAKLLEDGAAPEAVLSQLKNKDNGHRQRQVHVMHITGMSARYTGDECIGWAGHKSAPNLSLAGNMLAGANVLEDMLNSYHDNAGKPLQSVCYVQWKLERLLVATSAGANPPA